MKHLKLFEEYIPFITDKRKVKILDFIYNKLKSLYESDDLNYTSIKQPNSIRHFEINNNDIYH